MNLSFKFAMAIALLFLVVSCCEPCPEQEISDFEQARNMVAELVKKNAPNTTFEYKGKETDTKTKILYQNKEIGEVIELDDQDQDVLIGFAAEQKEGEENATTFKTTLQKKGNKVTLVQTNLITNTSITKDFGIPDDIVPVPSGYDSIDECMADFWEREGADLQAQANETCETVVTGVLCCLKDGICYYVDFIHIKPTNPYCLFTQDMIFQTYPVAVKLNLQEN